MNPSMVTFQLLFSDQKKILQLHRLIGDMTPGRIWSKFSERVQVKSDLSFEGSWRRGWSKLMIGFLPTAFIAWWIQGRLWHMTYTYIIYYNTDDLCQKATMVSIHNFSNQPGPDVKWILNQQRHFWFSTLQVTSLVAMNISKGSWLAICVHVSPILMLDSLLHWKF